MFTRSLILLSLTCLVVGFTDDLWNEFKQKYGRQYGNSIEENVRRRIFNQNTKAIAKHNLEADLELHTFTLAVNQFADLTNAEYQQLLGFRVTDGKKPNFTFALTGNELPDTLDWRPKNLVTPVKNQGSCGSCWAFSAVASLEGQNAKKTGKLESFSEQQLVDCSSDEGNQGCNGGDMVQSFEYLKKSGGIELEDEYPYTASDDDCKFDKSKIAAKITGYVKVKEGDEKALQEATATVGPISVALDAGSFWFQFYFGGVYSQRGCNKEAEKLNHAVTVIGYGTEKNKDYWLIKNSWGTGWGSKGIMKLQRNADNMCGVATAASYPLV